MVGYYLNLAFIVIRLDGSDDAHCILEIKMKIIVKITI